MESFFKEFKRMQKEMDALFDSYMGDKKRLSYHGNNSRTPVTDLVEADKEYITRIELPGVDKKDIHLDIDEHGASIKVESKQEKETKKKGNYSYYRSFSGFSKYFSLPPNADGKQAMAEMKNGVLEIRFPKKQIANNKKKRIAIK